MPEPTINSSELIAFKSELLHEIKILLESYLKKPSNELIKSCQVKQILGCSDSKLQTLRKSGKLKYLNVLGTLYYLKDDVDALLLFQQPKH
jgi:hypothetical protein